MENKKSKHPMNVVQTWIWLESEKRLDSLLINKDQICTLELHTDDPLYDRPDIFGCIPKEDYVPGLTVWLITMSNGREIKVPVPTSWRTTIWKALDISEGG
jgi:hypothetical protein